MHRKPRVVARSSALSLAQVREVFSFLPEMEYSLIAIESVGDRNKHIPLTDNVAADFFTRELDEMLLAGKADIAIHSAKDLPYPLPAGLELFALFAATDKTDSLVSRDGLTLAQLPAGARVGTSSAVRRSELLNLRSDLTVTDIRGTIEERIAQADSGCIDALIVATCALHRLNLHHRIAEILPFRTHDLQGHLAVAGRAGDTELKKRFAPFDVRRLYGKVTLVGFGPGNPDLLTIGGDRAMAGADIIFYDDLTDRHFLDTYGAEKVYVGKRKDRHSHSQQEIHELLYRSATAGRRVVRLKGGDPMIFAHGREELDFLQSRFVETDVIPGITSGIALAACTHIPLTHRGVSSSVAFVSGHAGKDAPVPANVDTLIYYMGGAHISDIAAKLLDEGYCRDTPVALACNVSLPNQKVFFSSLGELQFSAVKYPSPILVAVGKTVSFESGKAVMQNTLVTGTAYEKHAAHGRAVHIPLIKIQKQNNPALGQILLEGLKTFDWIVFTSRYGVRYFFELLDETRFDIRAMASIRIASTGRTTSAELYKHHLRPDVESSTGSAEGLIRHFVESRLSGLHILLPRSDRGLKHLPDALAACGNSVTDLPVYRNTPDGEAKTVDLSHFHRIIFSSPSCVEAFMRLYGELPPETLLAARGKTTLNTLKHILNETFQNIPDIT
ncbi:MAG: uroporphyrinogen-III C-methyltransferase [Tannerella sp.]|jgi:uroporphyrinogen III methyltransferase/synthase|nr:uroporphyrinogen-III C-methyltransferase [Tannerella sp.]